LYLFSALPKSQVLCNYTHYEAVVDQSPERVCVYVSKIET
jgi:hypothetical protein